MTALKDLRTVERSRLDYALVGLIILVIVLGLAKQLGQAGLVAGFAALLTYIAESPGSLRQRAGGMLGFAVFCFVQILLVGLIGSSDLALLILLFAVSFVCSRSYSSKGYSPSRGSGLSGPTWSFPSPSCFLA